MALSAPKGNDNKKFAPQANLEPGTYPARLVQIIDLGLQAQKPYQGKDKSPAQEVMFTYELVDSFMLDESGNEIEEKPRWISETLPMFPLFADRAKSTQRYNAFDPKGDFNGDFSLAIGMAVNVAIVNNTQGDKTYDNIGGVGSMRPKDSEKCTPLKNPTKLFDADEPNMEVFNTLPKWIQDKIKGNLNYQGSALQKALGEKVVPIKKAAFEEPEDVAVVDEDVPY